jgi:hypothetical protein
MSSVLGLKVSPSTAMVLPRTEPPQAAHLAAHGALALLVHRRHRLHDADRRLVILRGLDQRQRVLGKHEPP